MAYEYEIVLELSNFYYAFYYTDLREKGWAEVWKIWVHYRHAGNNRYEDIALPPKDYPQPRHEFYLAPSRSEAQAKAEKIARDHAAKLKAEALRPLKYKFTVE